MTRMMNALLDTLGETKAHFVCCVKPNSHFAPRHFDDKMIATQLRRNGTLEAMRRGIHGGGGRTSCAWGNH